MCVITRILFLCHSHNFITAPSAAPLNVQVSLKGPYSITLEWSPPPPIDRNGVIIYYQLKLEEVETETVLEWTSPELMTTRNSLHPHFNYNCSVAAHTSAGTGPFSGELQVSTGTKFYRSVLLTHIQLPKFYIVSHLDITSTHMTRD